MAVRLLHTADWQIGKPFGRFPVETAHELRAQRLRTVEAVAALARTEGADAVLVAGDAFDSNTVGDRTLLQTMEALRGFDGPWVFLPGNHDAALGLSAWSRLRALGHPANVVIADAATPLVLCGGRLAVLPAPLRRRHEAQDVTAWFDRAATPAEAIRVGLAHGTLANRLPGEATNIIAEDRAVRAGLAYLALGDWHGALAIGPRTAYAGTPEPDRFRTNESGTVSLVDIEGPDAEPRVRRVPVGRFRWLRQRIPLLDGTCTAMVEALEALPGRTLDTVLVLDLAGSVTLAERHRLQGVVAHWAARLMHLQVNEGELRDEPSPDDLDAIDTGGFVRLAVDRLRTMAANPGQPGQAARMALRMLYLDHVGQGR